MKKYAIKEVHADGSVSWYMGGKDNWSGYFNLAKKFWRRKSAEKIKPTAFDSELIIVEVR